MQRVWLLLVICLAAAHGCLFRASEPRYFQPDSAAIQGVTAESLPPQTGAPIRLRAVRAASQLRERIAWRSSPVEHGFYEERRWSDLPASYVQRAFQTRILESPRLRLSSDFRVATLRVDLMAFEEVLAPAHLANVTLMVSLQDGERQRLLERRFAVEVPISGDDAADTAHALGRALDQVVDDALRAIEGAVAGE